MTQGSGLSPEFLELIRRAATETISIPLASKGAAVKLRQRLHSARKYLMRAAIRPSATPADNVLASLAEAIETSIDESEGSIKLIVRPRDSQFREALRAAGIGTQPQQLNPVPSMEPEIEPEPTSTEPASDVLSTYLKGDKA